MKLKNSLILLLTATIWGVAFVAQSVGMDYVGPFTFNCVRFLIGGLVLIPCITVIRKFSSAPDKEQTGSRRDLIAGGISCGIVICIASCLQQIGIMYTTVGKAGFITACYILIVPVLGIFFRKKCGILVWAGVILALFGLYFLCMNESFRIQKGDAIVFLCAVVFSVHILVIDHFSPKADGVMMSCIQFFTAGILCAVPMLLFEKPQFAQILAAWQPILYAGVMSCGVAYTLQIVGQKGMNPTVASLILSLESVISVLAGMIILGQKMSGREILGCILMSLAILLAQIPRPQQEKN